MKILYIDIETTPLTALTWGAYEQNALSIVEDWRVLGAAYAWNDDKVKLAYPKHPDIWPLEPDECEAEVLAQVWTLLDEADMVIAHNGDKFDLRKLNARLIRFGYGPPSPYLSIDTLKVARKHFAFTQNKLDYLGQYLGAQGKLSHTGLQLWLDCMAGDPKAWSLMKRYNKRDVELLRDVYKILLPWISNHPHIGGDGCPKCGSMDLVKRGIRRMKSGIRYNQLRCNTCGGYSRAARSEPDAPELRP